MTTNKILSFEEFSSTSATATADAATATRDAAVATDATDATTTDTDTNTDTDTVDTETTDTEETTTDAEETETDEDVEEAHDGEDHDDAKTVAEMVMEMKEAVCNEAKAYEADEYDEHTVETYMKEKAAMDAKMITEALEEVKETYEGYTKEAYESTCNELKETYAKKIDEMVEAYQKEAHSGEDHGQEEGAVIAEPVK